MTDIDGFQRADTFSYPLSSSVFYRPTTSERERRRRQTNSFPTPQIRARPHRPQSIHIISYPPGYTPPDLRPLPEAPIASGRLRFRRDRKEKKDKKDWGESKVRKEPEEGKGASTSGEKAHRSIAQSSRRVFERIVTPFKSHFLARQIAQDGPKSINTNTDTDTNTNTNTNIDIDTNSNNNTRNNDNHINNPNGICTCIGSSNSNVHTDPDINASEIAGAGTGTGTDTSTDIGTSVNIGVSDSTTTSPNCSDRRNSDIVQRTCPPLDPRSNPRPRPRSIPIHLSSSPLPAQQQPLTSRPLSTMSTIMDPRRPPVVSATAPNSNRNSIISMRSAKSIAGSSVSEIPKPVASGSGVSCSILLAEPNVFLTGFEHDGSARHETSYSTALLRGKLRLDMTKNVKLKSVTLKLSGRARTEWPEGIPPMKVEQYEDVSLRTQVLTFFNAMHETWETEYGNQCTYSLRGRRDSVSESSLGPSTLVSLVSGSQATSTAATISVAPKNRVSFTSKEYKRLSLQSVQSRSFEKGDSAVGFSTTAKGYKVFYPGTYEYSFELPIDHHQLETIKLPFGSVKWQLETVIERAGAFKPNLQGHKEVCVVRVPDQLSLEMTEPISISRLWEDQLHYDIMISGKSFPIGTKIPIAFKLTPLAKVQIHKLKVFATESIEYWTNDRRVTRKDQPRKILLLEKSAGKPLDSQYYSSNVRVLSGGELSPEERSEARRTAARRRSTHASGAQSTPRPLPDQTDNILGDLDLGLESFWGPTEIEMDVQIPTCEQMAQDKTLRLNPDCSWKNAHVYHWIKIVMRISRLDPEDPAGKRRRHFEISIDSPFTVLNCRATHANMSLPEYTGTDQLMNRQQSTCSCPDANVLATQPSPSSSQGNLPPAEPNVAASEAVVLPVPPAAHISTHIGHGTQALQRPMHLMRYPSFNPPAFDAEQAPPPMPTPPPDYDVVIGTPSVDGLADYFARLAEHQGLDSDGDDSEDDEHLPTRLTERTGRVNVANPRTPGGRSVPSRSLEIERPTLPITLNMAGALVQRRG